MKKWAIVMENGTVISRHHSEEAAEKKIKKIKKFRCGICGSSRRCRHGYPYTNCIWDAKHHKTKIIEEIKERG